MGFIEGGIVRPPIIHTYHRKGKSENNQEIVAANSVREGRASGTNN